MLNDNGGNDNTSGDSSPESVGGTNELESVGSEANAPPMSAREFLSRRQEIREKQTATKMTKDKSKSAVASGEDESSEENDVSQASTNEREQVVKKEVANPKFQQRIDKLTAKYHDAERKSAEKDIQIEKLMKATEILQKELERVARSAKLDPREERIRELELQREVDKFASGLDNKHEEIYNKSLNEYQVQSRADEILEEVESLTQEYDLVSPEEILLAMRDRGLTAAAAARQIHNSRLQLAQKKTSQVKHPQSVSKTGATGTNQPPEPYRGSETIKKFFLQRIAERNGRAE